ncbi:hypothetical protein BP5796_06932 [Coleophoma crateriformis]|uniref:Xylanolytic transcriptional activator regulatory domain-containing protein n=1 Tax=Coleophoma crateriformis TaxID=565419 RepID=A0A3D8RQM2_9HELO|nr:hypothetical protein BP5796_06932 [Coleophoma crateriformis]
MPEPRDPPAVQPEAQRPAKRTRCDGTNPCASCKNLNLNCEFIIPKKPTPIEKKHYVKALEDRVAYLESFLAKEGIGALELGRDNLQLGQNPNSTIRPQHGNHIPDGLRNGSTSPTSGEESLSESPEEADSLSSVLRDLSLEATGGYIGASASISMGRMVTSIVKGREQEGVSRGMTGVQSRVEPLEQSVFRKNTDIVIGHEEPMLVSRAVADRLLTGYMKHISTRWPILYTPQLRRLDANKDFIEDTYEKSTLHLVYAIGGRFLETTGEAGPFYPEMHYNEALQHLDEILRFHDTRSIITLLLLAIYCLRAPGGPGAWTYVGLAMRICIDLGLHRKVRKERMGLEAEMRKRIFWSCYFLDRQVSIVLGRPFAISDHDIDVPLPLEVDEASDDINDFYRAAASTPTSAPAISTSLSSFLHVLRLRRIESSIQHRIYRVDRESSQTVSNAEIDYFVEQLEHWKSMIPLDTHKKVDSESTSFDGYDYYVGFLHVLVNYANLSIPDVELRYLKACAEACGGTVFLAGLTLIYCIWISPAEIFNIATSNNLNSCSIVLYIITERWPGARRYRDAFEGIKHTIIDLVSRGEHRPRKVVAEVASQSKNVNINVDAECGDEFWSMVSEMAGNDRQYPDFQEDTSLGTFVSDPNFDAQLITGNMDTAIGFEMDGMLSHTELFGDMELKVGNF